DATHPPTEPRPNEVNKPESPRTFENSVVRPWSWPSVLVLVKKWHADSEYEHVPNRIYLPDGRIVPTCVLLTTPDESISIPVDPPRYASSLIGGGYPVTRTSQGVTRLGTVACLVEREGPSYALSNRHVVGPDGGPIDARIRDELVRIGFSDPQSRNRVSMTDIFPEFPGHNTLVNLDAGLILLEDASQWTSQ